MGLDMIQIVNLRSGKSPVEPWEVYVDRRSPLGNPFKMKGNSEEERNRVCDEYDAWLNEALRTNPLVHAEFQRLLNLYRMHGQLSLYCWCAPKRCHAESIAAYIGSMCE